MKIVDTRGERGGKRFDEIAVGDAFAYGDEVFWKLPDRLGVMVFVDKATVPVPKHINAINFRNSDVEWFDRQTAVELVEVTVNVTNP